LPKGSAGNLKTVDVIKRVARQRSGHPLVRKLAQNILRFYNTKSQDFFNEAWAIGDYVHKRMAYVRDPNGIEMLQDPVTMIDMLKRDELSGDCDDMVLLIATLLLSIGHKPYLRIVRYPKFQTGFQHIYVVVYENNYRKQRKRLSIDAIVKDKPIGYEIPHSFGKEIKI
jgi:hypothetical protein